VEGKEGDFFNVMQYPTATFEVTGVADEAGKTMMSGNLTMLSISQNISFPVQVTSQDNMIQVKSETFTIDRTKWGINYGSKSIFDNLGDKFINDNMEITIDVTAVM
jgi:polyisoprenoid-binding protein YceI